MEGNSEDVKSRKEKYKTSLGHKNYFVHLCVLIQELGFKVLIRP